jgi:hypothetical protein
MTLRIKKYMITIAAQKTINLNIVNLAILVIKQQYL